MSADEPGKSGARPGLSGLGVGGEDRERLADRRAQNTEVPLVEREDAFRVVSAGENDNRSVREPNAEAAAIQIRISA